MSRSVIEQALLSGANAHAGSKHSDGTFPHNFWVGTNGNDGTGNGSQEAPYLTVRRAIRQAYDGRGDRILVMPGSYAETIDIGSGATAGGNTNGGYAKRDLQIIGDNTVHPGRVQIIGDGASAQPTIRVLAGYLRGFALKGLEGDTNGLVQAVLELDTNDTAASPTAASNHYRALIEDFSVRSNDPGLGILCAGTTLCIFRRILINGPVVSIGFTTSPPAAAGNTPSDLEFEDVSFFNGMSGTVTANVASVANVDGNPTLNGSVGTMTNIVFRRVDFGDDGSGANGVTNYINLASAITAINVRFHDCRFGQQPTNGTNGIATLPTNVVVLGHGTTGLVSLKG